HCRCDVVWFSSCRRASRALPSFPTRRSSDLHRPTTNAATLVHGIKGQFLPGQWALEGAGHGAAQGGALANADGAALAVRECGQRSEEHTSELQSRENLVCRLLLEKKKIMKKY